MRRLEIFPESWPIRGVFTIARGAKRAAELIRAVITEDGITGQGECVPYPRYGESIEGTRAAIESVRALVERSRASPAELRGALLDTLPPGAARNALDCALWELEAHATGTSVAALAALPAPAPAATAYTISLDEADAMGRAASAARERPLLKIKLGRDDILNRLRAVRAAAPEAHLIVDANESWTLAGLEAIGDALSALGVDLVEQPLRADADEGLCADLCPVPLCADESFHTAEDVARVAGRYGFVNIKLDKAGGLTAAIEAARAANQAGLGIMVGCMVGTSLGMAPALHLAPLARFVDLDGPLLLARDREPGLSYCGSTVCFGQPKAWG